MCGVFGLMFYGSIEGKHYLNLDKVVKELSIASQKRGSDATGMAFVQKDAPITFQKEDSSAKLMQNKWSIPESTFAYLGHTRKTTHGKAKDNFNNHPWVGKLGESTFAFAHNGVLNNHEELRKSEGLPATEIMTDSYIGVQLIEKYCTPENGGITLENLKKVAELVSGTFIFTIVDEVGNFYFINKGQPFNIVHFNALDFVVYASEKSILWDAMHAVPEYAELEQNILQGRVAMPHLFTVIETAENTVSKLSIARPDEGLESITFTPKAGVERHWQDYGHGGWYSGGLYGGAYNPHKVTDSTKLPKTMKELKDSKKWLPPHAIETAEQFAVKYKDGIQIFSVLYTPLSTGTLEACLLSKEVCKAHCLKYGYIMHEQAITK